MRFSLRTLFVVLLFLSIVFAIVRFNLSECYEVIYGEPLSHPADIVFTFERYRNVWGAALCIALVFSFALRDKAIKVACWLFCAFAALAAIMNSIAPLGML